MNNYTKIKDMVADQKSQTVLLLTAVEEKETKNHSLYCKVSLSDGESQIQANLWNTKKEDFLKKVSEKSLITVEIYPKIYQGEMTYELVRYMNVPDVAKSQLDISDFIISAPVDSQAMYDEILTMLNKFVPKDIHNQSLVVMVENIYHAHHDKLMYWSGAKSMHHNFRGGLLYHTFRMVRSAVMLAQVYKGIDIELLLCGTALHDIGKLYELETDELGTAEYSISGNLFGHAYIGMELIEKENQSSPLAYNPERVMLLKHMIASHHGQLDWGAITVPAIPEAMMLHEIDMIDSRMMMFEDAAKDLNPGEMSNKNFGLGTCAYKPAFDAEDIEF